MTIPDQNHAPDTAASPRFQIPSRPPAEGLLRTLRTSEQWVSGFAWSPDGATLIAATGGAALSVFDAASGDLCGRWSASANPALGMQASPFMLYTHQALQPDQTAAVTHVDGTSRVQTVSAEQNPYLYRILDAFERRTGVPVLINTSFNLRGEPIVSSPSDALKTFFASGIDCLALEDCLVDKEMAGVACITPEKLRTVHPITECEAFKSLYWSGELPGMVPNLVFVNRDGSVAFESNEAGLKGDPLDPARSLAVVWGDSVVFGAGRGWAHLLDDLAPGWQFLNGGLEGDPFTNILRRAAAFNESHKVALNLLMLGWHPFVPPRERPARRHGRFRRNGAAPAILPHSGNENVRAELTRFLQRVPNTAVLTMPTPLNPCILDQDLSPYLVDGDYENGFRFLGKLPYHREGQHWAFEHIAERNAITREVCARLGVQLIDLAAALDTADLPDFRENFLDAVHIRPRAFPLVARTIHAEIKDLVA